MRSGNDRDMGLYRKFEVTRHDPTGKHKHCFYFVLDVDHDENSIPALKAYIAACKEKFPLLARDLEAVVKAAEISGRFAEGR